MNFKVGDKVRWTPAAHNELERKYPQDTIGIITEIDTILSYPIYVDFTNDEEWPVTPGEIELA